MSSSREQGEKSLPTDHPSDMPVLKPVAGSSGLLSSQAHSEPEMDADCIRVCFYAGFVG